MIPVYQESFGYGQGSCAWACVASIFEVTHAALNIDKIAPPNDDDLEKWTELVHPELEMHRVDHTFNYRLIPGPSVPRHPHPERWAYDIPDEVLAPTDGFWMASIYSPGLSRPVEDPYYGMAALHAVVFEGNTLVHDPNPKYTIGEYVPRISRATWWT